MLDGDRKKYSSSPCSRDAREKAASLRRGCAGREMSENVTGVAQHKAFEGELSYAPKRDQEPGSCRGIHACLGGKA